jgi:hypothetical protein
MSFSPGCHPERYLVRGRASPQRANNVAIHSAWPPPGDSPSQSSHREVATSPTSLTA